MEIRTMVKVLKSTKAAKEKTEVLKKSQLFWRLSDTQIDQIAAISQELKFSAGSPVYHAGDSASHLYVAEKGKVSLEMEIRLGSRTRKQATIDVVTEGQVFGWPALFPEMPAYTMSAIVMEDVKLLALDGAKFQSLCDQDIGMCRDVMRELVSLVSNRFSRATKTLAHVLSVASHDLRAPLATVHSSLDVLLGKFVGEINSRQAELVAGSKQRIVDLLNIIDNILDISHIEISELDFEDISLAEVVEDSLGDVQGMAGQKEITVENKTAAKLLTILGHPKRLRQVLTNLLSNAIKFTPAGGTVSIACREKDDSITISVKDTGIGIPSDELPRIFDDFYRGMKAEEVSGAGIGLSVSKKIIEAHGGRIWAESPNPETGIGAKVSFMLPKVVSEKPAEEKIELGRKAIIIVADDDPQMLNVTSLVLESHGYTVLKAKNGQEVMGKLDQVIPDVLMLDILMPDMDGFEVLKKISEQDLTQRRGMSVIILSAVKEGSSRQRYELETRSPLPIADYLEKPISPPALLQRVEKVLQSKTKRLQNVDKEAAK